MKKIYLVLALFIIVSTIFAQCPITKGQTQFNAGLGFSSWGIPVYIGLDYGASNNFTLGGQLSYNDYEEDYYYDHHYNDSYHHSIIGIAGNGNYHFNQVMNIPRNWDFYAGLNVGFYIWNSSDNYHGSKTSGLGIGAQIGGRYYFTNKFGLNLELGENNAFSGGKIGISLKL